MPQVTSDSRTLPLNRGNVTGVDASLLAPGELTEAVGVIYSRSDPAARKMPGRVSFGTPSAGNAVNGLRFVSFNTGSDYVLAQAGGTLWSALSTVGTFGSIRTGLTASAQMIDATKFGDALFMVNGVDTNWVVLNSNTTIRQSLAAQTFPPVPALGGAGLTGTYIYWATEYDSVNGVESAIAITGATVTVSPVNQTVTITRPPQQNTSATHWRLYRTKTTGAFPVGWLLATTLMATTTYADSTSDANLVLGIPYHIVTINSSSESANQAAPVFRSIASHQGRLVGVYGMNTAWSDIGNPHYFPTSYTITHQPIWGGQARCVRSLGEVLLVFFDNECFRLNYLPSETDSTFDAGIAQERISNYGTPSPLGACLFSGWGGNPLVFFVSRSNPMITDGQFFDTACKNIDWQGLVPAGSLPYTVAIDNPDRYCIELYFDAGGDPGTAEATSDWQRLDFSYDPDRMRVEHGGFPELVWTGPHPVPGPGIYGILAGAGQVWAGSRGTADAKVYKEGIGFSDAANLTDSSGTVPFRLTTGKLYADGPNSECRVSRIFLHKASNGSGSYSVTLTTHREGNEDITTTHTISAVGPGVTSEDFNKSAHSFDVRVTYDGTTEMPNLNNITVLLEDIAEYQKTDTWTP